MIEVLTGLYVGDESDYNGTVRDARADRPKAGWAVVHACKEPFHRQAIGYSGRSLDRDHPEYLVARRDREIMLNMIDAPDPRFISSAMIDPALAFIAEQIGSGRKVLSHCNQGRSRGPTIAMLYIASQLPEDFAQAEEAFLGLYPEFAPAGGCRGFASENWARYRARHAYEAMQPPR